MTTLDAAYKSLRNWFSECAGALVALSGGVDSSLLAWLARHFLGPEQTLAVISASSSLKRSDLDDAKKFCSEHDIGYRVIHTVELSDPNYSTNPINRCYFCKSILYKELNRLQDEFEGWTILNGTNADDLGDYRPGLKAADELAVKSPLLECGIGKEQVRELAKKFHLHCWDKPASPCLSSRIPYGENITETKLRRIEAAENWLNEIGFVNCRVRHVGDIARIEVPIDQLGGLPHEWVIDQKMRTLGFEGMEVDPDGFVSGKLNRGVV